MPHIRSLTEVSTAQYDAYITLHGNTYHTRAWLHLLRRAYGYQPATLVAQDEAGQIRGVLPLMRVHGRLKGRRLVSLPFSHCVPLLADDAAVENALLEAAIQMARQERYAYLELKPRQPITQAGFQPSTLNYISELSLATPAEEMFEAFTTSNRRNIRKGEKAGFVLREGTTPENLTAFYNLEVATRRYQGAPVYPLRFFHLMAEELGAQMRLYLFSLDGEDVAGMVLLQTGKLCIYGYGAWLRAEHLKRLYPMNALVWMAIQRAQREGYQVFDFGTTPLHNQGLLDFKQRYNPTLSELPYWYFLHTRPNLPIIKRDGGSVKLVESVLKYLPRPLFVRLSPLLLREVG